MLLTIASVIVQCTCNFRNVDYGFWHDSQSCTRLISFKQNYNITQASKSTYSIDHARTNYGKLILHFSGPSVPGGIIKGATSRVAYLKKFGLNFPGMACTSLQPLF